MSANNVFQKINRTMDGPMSIMAFLTFFGLFVIGLNFFAEDTVSSYEGVQMLEQKYDLQAATWPFTYWAISLAPQFMQIGFFYIFLSDTKNHKWALAVAAGAFLIDAIFDLMYRSNGYMGNGERAVAIGGNTAIYSLCAELLISIGFGYALTLAKPAWAEVNKHFGGGGGGGGRGRRSRRSSGGSSTPSETPVTMPTASEDWLSQVPIRE